VTKVCAKDVNGDTWATCTAQPLVKGICPSLPLYPPPCGKVDVMQAIVEA